MKPPSFPKQKLERQVMLFYVLVNLSNIRLSKRELVSQPWHSMCCNMLF